MSADEAALRRLLAEVFRQSLAALDPARLVAEALHVAGGHTRNELLMELYADAVGLTVIEPAGGDAVLLRTGMAAAAAAGIFRSVQEAAASMRQPLDSSSTSAVSLPSMTAAVPTCRTCGQWATWCAAPCSRTRPKRRVSPWPSVSPASMATSISTPCPG